MLEHNFLIKIMIERLRIIYLAQKHSTYIKYISYNVQFMLSAVEAPEGQALDRKFGATTKNTLSN